MYTFSVVLEIRIQHMEKIYSNNTKPKSEKLPSKKTKDFILNYSKALHIQQCKGLTVEMLIN
ncbi:hypothetical protein GCM10010832_07950 [Psychroflexus planctonicus]|uniref:Uncharacterized protein n=1 Tax=Psychroflexus planctonicus TaxID=1526575 RepID=A0ABQ1SD88_9FLAO|nr:hypothetical protein GCM10010832_07950 [Psychroflexus planctonicus]